jgi:hypothetical protein
MKANSLVSGLPAGHPLRAARWIWPEAYMYLHNHYAQFRRDFDLVTPPRKAPLFITADKAYKLYINGRFVCRGPARGYQSHWPYDEVDVAAFLRAGHNWISVEGYNPGISTFQYIHQTQAGFICAARWGKFEIKTGEKEWIYRRSPAHHSFTARYSMQLDFQEDFDATLADRAWITSPEAPEGWVGRYAPRAQYMTNIPLGRPPWETLEPRGIPLMREEVLVPAGITAHGEGASAADYRTRNNISWGWNDEAQKIAWDNGKSVSCKRATDALQMTIAPTGSGRFRAVTLDLGKMAVADLIVEVESAQGGEILDFQFDQCLRKGTPEFIPTGTGCSIALANRLRLKKGQNSHEFFHLQGFRHVTVIARDLRKPLALRLSARAAGYPFAMQGTFDCSDATLNQIHAACRHTQQLCSLDAYVDTPWREQAQWWGDARVQARNTFYLDGDARLVARGIRSIAAQATSQGLTYGHAPTSAYNCILPDFSLTWILTIRDHWWQTGSTELLDEQWPRIQQVLDYFDTPEARGRHGLLRFDSRFWYFGDWADICHAEIPTFLNLWYLYTLRQLADLLAAANRRADARARARKAAVMEKEIVRRLFDAKAQMFRDGLDAKGKPVARFSVHEQVMALMLGLVPQAHATMISQRVLPYLREEKVDGAIPSAFWSTYLFEEMSLRGYATETLAFIRRKWEPMLSTGTTWEGFDWSETVGGSCAHAWTAHPSYHFVNILAGVWQTAPNWKTIRFTPHFAKNMNHARAVVPSPPGMIEAGWTRNGNRIRADLKIPAGVTAIVELPGIRKTIRGKTSVHFDVQE